MTFRQDSDISIPYDKFEPIDENTAEDEIWTWEKVQENVSKKKKPVLQFVSDCTTPSKREDYIKELSKHINVTIFGKCNKRACSKECEANEIDQHMFYLAFENSICNNYITEKFWRLKKLIVPIVMNREIYQNSDTQDSFIAASDFKSPVELALFLKNLSVNREEYLKYFAWTQKYKKTNPVLIDLCELCQIAWSEEKYTVNNLVKWWETDAKCIDDYGTQLIPHQNRSNCPNNDKVKALPHFARDCCKYDNPERLNNFQEQYLKTSGDYLQSYKYFHPYRNEIKEILKCSDKVMKNVTKTAKSLFKKDNSHLLCTHIRRTDFLEDLMLESKVERTDFLEDLMLESKVEFVQPAIEFALKFLMNKSHEHISLMLFGDDHKFIKENITLSHLSFDHVYLLNSTTRGEDFCLAVNYCDSMIMTASGSTFSWWISYLMPKNSTIFYNTQVSDTADFSKDTFDYDYFLPEWIRLTASNGTVNKKFGF
uniref:Fucosyltransferase n=1 Tax=Acrobeloides nanus TaxID=290746 RepID=A0A914CYF2_9BILA